MSYNLHLLNDHGVQQTSCNSRQGCLLEVPIYQSLNGRAVNQSQNQTLNQPQNQTQNQTQMYANYSPI